MRPLVFHDTAAMILFVASVVLVNVIDNVLLPRSSSRSPMREDWSLPFAVACMISGITAASIVAGARVAPLPGEPWWPVVVGLLLMWGGLAFRAWAILTMGRFFQMTVVVQEGHKVVDNGPYRWLRHPGYLGLVVLLTGVGVAEGDWISIALTLAGGLVAMVVRIRVEERVLFAELGEDYASFAKGRARLVPGLY